MENTISLAEALKICDRAFALYGDEGCIVHIVKRDDGDDYNYTERHPDSNEDAVEGVIAAIDNERVKFQGGCLWFWVRGDFDEPNQTVEFQVSVVGHVNVLAQVVEPWADIPDFPVADWKAEVAGGETRMGYLDWVANHQ